MELMATVIGIFIANAGLICWFRSESRSDWKHMDAKIDAIQAEIKDFSTKWMQETKDFHGRLCAIEEKNKGK